jgi:hypothetical protein
VLRHRLGRRGAGVQPNNQIHDGERSAVEQPLELGAEGQHRQRAISGMGLGTGQLSARLCLSDPPRRVDCVWSGLHRAGESDKGAYADSGPARSDIPVRLALQKRWAGNVQMCPSDAFCHELPEESGG